MYIRTKAKEERCCFGVPVEGCVVEGCLTEAIVCVDGGPGSHERVEEIHCVRPRQCR